MQTTALMNASNARTHVARTGAGVDVIDVAIFVLACAACGVLFLEGGFFGLIGAVAGSVFGWLRPQTSSARGHSAFRAAFAGLWGLLMVGGAFAATTFMS